ncbi:hypothetical protein EMM73_19710 [Rheinheimera sediminis]|uniref:hypothetical protein n=1 Tax=Rheinheimera sp. YQF-1 TaxID=2499626 RepID=UPI000FD6FDF7|nr:hypothetical protein [Rheinheimera sp. YQF-1]RVT40107.1 hypothetical protein EMM73_19710 [Rheinheimera sp. YQF-1]
MSVFGPLGSLDGYIVWIAFENVKEYLAERDDSKDVGPRFVKFRRFLIAIESLNNIPDYIYHEWNIKKLNGKSDKQFKEHIHKRVCPALEQLSQIANGYKHRVRNKSADLGAKEIQGLTKYTIGRGILNVEYNTVECSQLVEEAFRFWHGFRNTPDQQTYLQLNKL